MDNQDALGVLKQLERGEISASEADARLDTPPFVESEDVSRVGAVEMPTWVRRIWVYPLIGGILTVLLGAWIITATVHANILWLLLGVPIVLLGTLVLAIAAAAYSGHWVYVNIEQSRKRRHTIRFGVPFSMGLLRLGLWIARRTTPNAPAKINVSTSRVKFDALWEDSDAFFAALERELAEGRGITVDVEGKDERVRVYIV
jgi:hypothetical protein